MIYIYNRYTCPLQPLPVVVTQRSSKGYRLYRISGYRVAGDTQQGYWLQCCRFRSVAGSRVYQLQIQCWQQIHLLQRITGSGVLPVPECTSFKSSADNRFTCYRELPVPECCRFRSVPASNPVLTTDSPVTGNCRFWGVACSGVLQVTKT